MRFLLGSAGPDPGTAAADSKGPLDARHAEALRPLAVGEISTSRGIRLLQAKSRLRAAADAQSDRPRAPSPVRYAWRSWLCNFCDGANRPDAESRVKPPMLNRLRDGTGTLPAEGRGRRGPKPFEDQLALLMPSRCEA